MVDQHGSINSISSYVYVVGWVNTLNQQVIVSQLDEYENPKPQPINHQARYITSLLQY